MIQNDSVRAEAAAWIAKMHGPERSPELEAGLRRWLAEAAEHALVFERMTSAWEDATHVAAGRCPRLRASAAPQSRPWVRAAAVVSVCGITALLGYSWWSDTGYGTAIGEQRSVWLEDGSRVSLNSATRIVVKYAESARHISLEKGEAFFEVAADPRRPFVVAVGGRHVTALGTSFSVRYEPDRIAVVLVDGKVAVGAEKITASTSEFTQTITLVPGQRLLLSKVAPPLLDTPRVDVVTAWRRGEVVFDKMMLPDAIAEMNRYDRTQLSVEGKAAQGLRVSGIYRTGDNAGFARAVARMYQLRMTEEGERIQLLDRQ